MSQPTLLLINKFFHDIGPAGGVGRYVLQEHDAFVARGWNVVPFAMSDSQARPSNASRFFVRSRDYSNPRLDGRTIGDAISLLWNREASKKLDALIAQTRPDVAHIHNIYHHISPSILPVLARHKIKTIMTLHDSRLLCPAIHMLRDGETCHRCEGGRYFEAIRGRCVHGSAAASALAAMETWHHRRRRIYRGHVQTFVCPSRHIRDLYIAHGYPGDRMVLLPNFVDLHSWRPSHIDITPNLTEQDWGHRDTYVYFGRLSKEKGVKVLLQAHAHWISAAKTTGESVLNLEIIGDGPAAHDVRQMAADLGLRNVCFHGQQDIGGIQQVLKRARFTVMPSLCAENGPLVALESLASGLPVLGSDSGGMPESIRHGETGFLIPRGKPELIWPWLRRAAVELGPGNSLAARRWAEENAGSVEHVSRLQNILNPAAPE